MIRIELGRSVPTAEGGLFEKNLREVESSEWSMCNRSPRIRRRGDAECFGMVIGNQGLLRRMA